MYGSPDLHGGIDGSVYRGLWTSSIWIRMLKERQLGDLVQMDTLAEFAVLMRYVELSN